METKDIRVYRGNLAEFREMYGKKSKVVKVKIDTTKTLENDVFGCIPTDHSKTRLDENELLQPAKQLLEEHDYLVDVLESIGADSMIRYNAQRHGNLILVNGIPVKRQHD